MKSLEKARRAGLKANPKLAHPDNEPKVVYLKAWNKPLARADYDFTTLADWPKEALTVAWYWELERELGSGNSPFYPAWQKWASRECSGKPQTPQECQPMLHAYPLALAARCLDKRGWKTHEACSDYRITGRFAASVYARIHPLEIDWCKSEKELLEAFRNWLRDGEHEFRPNVQGDSRHKIGKRNTAGLRSYFRDLAIYRIATAGIKRKDGGMEKLEAVGMLRSKELIRSENWSHAQDRTKEKIRKRIGTLCWCAKMEAQGGNKEGFWKDHFMQMNNLKPLDDKFEV